MERYIEFPATSKDWKKFELNNEVALNILYVPNNTRKINVAYKSKNNLTCDKQVILLMINDGEKCCLCWLRMFIRKNEYLSK